MWIKLFQFRIKKKKKYIKIFIKIKNLTIIWTTSKKVENTFLKIKNNTKKS